MNEFTVHSLLFLSGAAAAAAAIAAWRRLRNRAGALERRLRDTEESLDSTVAALRHDKERIEAILESMFEGIIVIEPDGIVRFVNDVFARLFRSPVGAIAGKNYWEIFRNERLHRLIREALETRTGMQGEYAVSVPEERHFQVQISPILAKEEFLGIVVTLHDMTSVRKLENLRSEFVANVSHELKTPLASIIGAADTLKGGAVDDRDNRGEFLDMIENHAQRLRKLIDDLLGLAHVEAGGNRILKRPMATEEILLPLKKQFAAMAREKDIALEFRVLPDTPAVPCDPGNLGRALANLVENALKYTDAGGRIAVEAAREGGEAVFSVTDTGMGIGEEDLGRIFERFYRAEKSRSRDAGGTGLGLSIVKHVAEAHGGRVEVESRPQHGSTFRLRIPL